LHPPVTSDRQRCNDGREGAFVAVDRGVPEGSPNRRRLVVFDLHHENSRWSQGWPANNGCGPHMSEGDADQQNFDRECSICRPVKKGGGFYAEQI